MAVTRAAFGHLRPRWELPRSSRIVLPPPLRVFKPDLSKHRALQQSTTPRRSIVSSARCRASRSAEQYEELYSSNYRGQGARRDRPPWYKSPPMIVLAIMPVFTAFLGAWQLQRLKWKVELIEELEDKLKRQPVSLPRDLSSQLLESLTFRLVDISGTFDYSRAIFVGPRVREGQVGCNVIVPFARTGGGAEVLVNRGFVSDRELVGKDASKRLRDDATRETKATITAMLPRIYPPNFFTPENDGQKGAWFHADPKEIADWMSGPAGALPLADQPDTFVAQVDDAYTPSGGVTESVKSLLGLGPKGERRVLPALFDEIFAGDATQAGLRMARGLPVGRAPSIELRNQHAVYAGTWFSLSAATAVMFAVLVRKGR